MLMQMFLYFKIIKLIRLNLKVAMFQKILLLALNEWIPLAVPLVKAQAAATSYVCLRVPTAA